MNKTTYNKNMTTTLVSGETSTITNPNEKFAKFEVVRDYSDHYYAKRKPDLTISAQKSIMKEWKHLQKELQSESIYVRAYGTRIDLMRAAIVGSPGTPYEDGLFFFDMAFPSNYPSKPPLVHYHSFGYQISPIIYANGVICLDLLPPPIPYAVGRFFANAMWDPNQSSVFQVLLSIQALVLRYPWDFSILSLQQLEPIPYKEKLFFLSCKTMLRVLGAPMKNFEALVKQHFNDRAESILKACNAFRGGNEVSVVFKEKMNNRLYRDLVMALANNGASIAADHFLKQLMEEDKAKAAAAAAAAKTINNKKEKGEINLRQIWKKVVDKLDKIVQALTTLCAPDPDM